MSSRRLTLLVVLEVIWTIAAALLGAYLRIRRERNGSGSRRHDRS